MPERSMFRTVLAAVAGFAVATADLGAQGAQAAAGLAPGQTCSLLTQANADASWDNGLVGTPNIRPDGTAVPGVPLPDISRGFQGIPRSAQPPLTASQRRILECTYFLAEANAEMPYTLFVPTTYDPSRPNALIVNLHGLDVTPLMQILFDGTTDHAERYGFLVVAPMGYSVRGGWAGRPGDPVETAEINPATGARFSASELSEIDAMRVLEIVRRNYNVDEDRIYLMGHSMGGSGTYVLGRRHVEIWAGLAPLAGAGGITSAEMAAEYGSIPILLMHGDRDAIVSVNGSRRSAMWLQEVGAQHVYLEFSGADHEFWIRRGAENMEKVFHFFSMVSKDRNAGRITPDRFPAPGAGR